MATRKTSATLHNTPARRRGRPPKVRAPESMIDGAQDISDVPLELEVRIVDPMAVQVGGDHYKKMPIQPMEYSMVNGLDACQHTIVKYVTRFRDKGGVQDLEKAKHVIDMLIGFELKKALAKP